LRAVAQRELFGELAIVVAESSRLNRIRCSGGFGGRVKGIVALVSEATLVGEAVIAHDQRGQAIGECIYAGPWFRVGALVRPDNIEARVDAWDREPMQGRVAKGEGGEVVGVREL
jgi:hypothetical protein